MISRFVRWLVVLSLLVQPAYGAVTRFALVVGNNRGSAGDAPLRYAESDADKISSVLRELGDFRPENIVLLRGENAGTVRRALISLNDRLRSAQAMPATEALLFVYYSGHADAEALHLGSSRLEFSELAQLVRGSSAKVRMLVVDACRSGTLTRVKGGKIVKPFSIASASLRGEGMVFLTASSANEDAQESDELRGSFFTHALVSGLLGAADSDGDGAVAVEEVYRHAYDATLRATSRTFAGTQHPTFQYDVKGQGSLVLTRPAAAHRERATLEFPPGIGFLVMAGDPRGAVIGEVEPGASTRSMSVRPGRYFLRGRGSDFLLEGTLSVQTGQVQRIDPKALERVEYARLVRKGGRENAVAHGPELGFAVRTPLPNAASVCWGGLVGYRWELESLGIGTRLGACRSGTERESIRATTDELALSVSLSRTLDLAALSVVGGAGIGGTLTFQHFESRGDAPDRLSLSPLGFALVGAVVPVWSQFYVGLDLRAEAHLIRWQRTALDEAQLRAAFAGRGALVGGLQF